MSLKILQWLPTMLKNKIHFTLTCKVLYDLAPGCPSDLTAYPSLPSLPCTSHTGLLSDHLRAFDLLLSLSSVLFYILVRLASCHSVPMIGQLIREAFSGHQSKVIPYSSTELSQYFVCLYLK